EAHDAVGGVKELEAEVDEALKQLGAAEKKGREAQLAKQDNDLRNNAEKTAKPLVEERRFADAARVFSDAADKIRGSPSIQKDLERRADRLRLAASALGDIVRAVQVKGRSSGVSH